MLVLISCMGEIRQHGTPDIEFAATALLARSQLATGQPDDARRTVGLLRARFADSGLVRFLPNMDALLCRIALHRGGLDAVDIWYRDSAPRDPLFLQPPLASGETLTTTELQILRLLCADKSNAEIGQIMDIKLTTVKTHVSHILEKLGVSRRSEAKTATRKLWLLPEEH